LAVDDSAVARQLIAETLSADPTLEVRVAADPLIAMRKIASVRPDVILLDLEMPKMDGLTFLRTLMAEDPIPVVICSDLAPRGTRRAIEALDAGAVDVVAKPGRASGECAPDVRKDLSEALRSAAKVQFRRRLPIRKPEIATAREPRISPPVRAFRLVGIAASTGGLQALRAVLESLPAACPPILIVQHMPHPFTDAMAQHLDAIVQPKVREARSGDLVEPGLALIAPGNRHMMLILDGARPRVTLSRGPRVSGHRPSADVLFQSIAKRGASGSLGIVLTGMGRDGAKGLAEMRNAGSSTLVQNEASCAVFGMPNRAIKLGAAEQILSLRAIPQRIMAGRPRDR
jgi:two-component system chemotaxis response regulator CheB